jgi:hypothetical protein
MRGVGSAAREPPVRRRACLHRRRTLRSAGPSTAPAACHRARGQPARARPLRRRCPAAGFDAPTCVRAPVRARTSQGPGRPTRRSPP